MPESSVRATGCAASDNVLEYLFLGFSVPSQQDNSCLAHTCYNP